MSLIACAVIYKQVIQCWDKHWQGFCSTSAQRANTLGTLSSQDSSLRCTEPNTALQVPCVKVPTTADHRLTHTSRTRCSTTPHNSTLGAKPPSLYDDPSVLHSTARNRSSTCSLFTIVRRCTNADRQMALIHTIPKSTMHRTETSPHMCDLTIP